MKAVHKYKRAARKGNKEAQRRIAQSFGYKYSIHDAPLMQALLERANIQTQPEGQLDTDKVILQPVIALSTKPQGILQGYSHFLTSVPQAPYK